MGVQSTRDLLRDTAEKLYVERYVEIHAERILREAKVMTDEELEDALETTFENFWIIR